jgi:hexulose-6-phosphate isomerase
MIKNRIGFMQGRLSPMIDGKIQSFPWENWENEFKIANKIKISNMEWTLDQENLYKNPLMTVDGQNEILRHSKLYELKIPSLTGDCFMQAPFFKQDENKIERLVDFENIVNACGKIGVRQIVIPLVDNSSIKNELEEKILYEELMKRIDLFKLLQIQIVFESDFSDKKLQEFIAKYPKDLFGINYDVGNSAALGFNPTSEIQSYGERIYNVHIKDRVLGGTTVPLGEGDADFDKVFEALLKVNYKGNFILQTARAKNNEHEEYLIRFNEFTLKKLIKWI